MKLRQGRFMVFVRRVGVFASCPHTMYQLGYTCMRLKEARKRYPWLCRLTRRRNRQHITDEDYDFRRVRVNRWYFE